LVSCVFRLWSLAARDPPRKKWKSDIQTTQSLLPPFSGA
jgi:hypothetical protein